MENGELCTTLNFFSVMKFVVGQSCIEDIQYIKYFLAHWIRISEIIVWLEICSHTWLSNDVILAQRNVALQCYQEFLGVCIKIKLHN